MKKLLATLALVLASSTFAAQPIDTTGLTPEQAAEITAQIAKMKSPVTTAVTIRKEAEAWGELGGNVGKAMVGAAKEVGVAANEFASTPLGTVVTAIVVYKIIGHDVIAIIAAIAIVIIGIGLGLFLLRTTFSAVHKYEHKPFLFGLWQRRVLIQTDEDRDYTGPRITLAILAFVVTFASTLIILF